MRVTSCPALGSETPALGIPWLHGPICTQLQAPGLAGHLHEQPGRSWGPGAASGGPRSQPAGANEPVRARKVVTSGGPGRRAAGRAAALPGRAPRAAAVVGRAPAAGRQARDELRGQPPRDAPQVQLLPQQGLELPAAALGTTKGRVGTAGGAGAGGAKEGQARPAAEPGDRRNPVPIPNGLVLLWPRFGRKRPAPATALGGWSLGPVTRCGVSLVA